MYLVILDETTVMYTGSESISLRRLPTDWLPGSCPSFGGAVLITEKSIYYVDGGLWYFLSTGRAFHRKAWHSFIRHRCVHFRLQTGGGGCLVMVELASSVVSCGGHRPPTNATNQCLHWKGHTSNTRYSCLIFCVCVIWSRRGCTKA